MSRTKGLKSCVVDQVAKTPSLYVTNVRASDDAATYRAHFNITLDHDARHKLAAVAQREGVSKLTMMRRIVGQVFATVAASENEDRRPNHR